MSDLLAAMEARERRRAIPDAPVAAVVITFIAAFFGSFALVPITLTSATRVASGLATSGEVALHYAMVVGIGLAAAAVVWAAIYVLSVRRARPGWGVGLFAGLAAMVVVLALAGNVLIGTATDRRQQESIASAEMDRVMGVFLTKGVDGDFSDTRPKARGEAGEIERVIKETLFDTAKVARQYNADIAALKLESLSPREIATSDARDIVARIRKGVALTVDYRNAVDDCIKRMQTRVREGRFSPTTRRLYEKGFEKGFVGTRAQLDRTIDLQIELLDLSEEQILFLDSHRSAWTVQNGQIGFRNRPDMNTFNERAIRIQRIGAEIEGIKRNQLSRMADIRDRFREGVVP